MLRIRLRIREAQIDLGKADTQQSSKEDESDIARGAQLWHLNVVTEDHSKTSPTDDPVTRQSDLVALKQEMNDRFDELKRHFDVVVENIEDLFRGANADELSSLHDRANDHEERLAALEGKRARGF
jgi:hypothetical protein